MKVLQKPLNFKISISGYRKIGTQEISTGKLVPGKLVTRIIRTQEREEPIRFVMTCVQSFGANGMAILIRPSLAMTRILSHLAAISFLGINPRTDSRSIQIPSCCS